MAKLGWLATVGKDILKGISYATAIAQGIDPLVQNTAAGKTINTVTSELSSIGNVVTIVESTANAISTAQGTGAQKLQAALPYVSSLIQASELVSGKQIQDEAGFENGCSQIITGVVSILNSLKAQGQQNTPATPPPIVPAAATPSK